MSPDVVVNVDADVTMEPDYFERLLEALERDPSLGIASGSAWEPHDGVWRQRFVITGGTVWGATRAYRWACLQDVLPLEERHGWDGIDQLKARARAGARDVHRPRLPPSPSGGLTRRIHVEALARERRHRVLHGLQAWHAADPRILALELRDQVLCLVGRAVVDYRPRVRLEGLPERASRPVGAGALPRLLRA